MTTSAERADQPYTRFLVPVLPVIGWDTELWIRNDGAEPVDVFPIAFDRVGHPVNCTPRSRCFEIPLAAPGVPPKATLTQTFAGLEHRRYYVPVQPSHAGAILYVQESRRDSLRLRLDVAGTQVPVVSESAFRSAPVSLPVHTLETARYALRVYSLDADSVSVVVRFYREVGNGGETLVAAIPLRLERPEASARCSVDPCPWPELPYAPSYAALFFDAQNFFPWRYRIEIDWPDGAKLWAMLSETNNVTRAVRVFVLD